jgi:hypothetical protein
MKEKQNKSPDEVFSFLWHYIQNEVPNSTKKLLLFSDRAAGQNMNYTFSMFLLNLCDSHRFETIVHFFPRRGYSFLPCDRDFGSIKGLLKKTDRVYTPQQYIDLILRASKCRRFSVHKVQTNEILNFKTWWPSFIKITIFQTKRLVEESKEN